MTGRDVRMQAALEAGEYVRWLALAADFDDAYYCASNPDVAASGMDPRLHYLRTGWLEGRNPAAGFDGDWYLRRNPDVAAAQINPLLHYVWQGRG